MESDLLPDHSQDLKDGAHHPWIKPLISGDSAREGRSVPEAVWGIDIEMKSDVGTSLNIRFLLQHIVCSTLLVCHFFGSFHHIGPQTSATRITESCACTLLLQYITYFFKFNSTILLNRLRKISLVPSSTKFGASTFTTSVPLLCPHNHLFVSCRASRTMNIAHKASIGCRSMSISRGRPSRFPAPSAVASCGVYTVDGQAKPGQSENVPRVEWTDIVSPPPHLSPHPTSNLASQPPPAPLPTPSRPPPHPAYPAHHGLGVSPTLALQCPGALMALNDQRHTCFAEQFRVRGSEVGFDQRMTTAAIIGHIIECAGDHAVTLWGRSESGFATAEEMGSLIFVMTRLSLKMKRYGRPPLLPAPQTSRPDPPSEPTSSDRARPLALTPRPNPPPPTGPVTSSANRIQSHPLPLSARAATRGGARRSR